MKAFIIAIGIGLVGCASNPVDVQRVEVPVVKGCVPLALPERPVPSFENLPEILTEDDSKEWVKALYTDFYTLSKYATDLEVVVAGCPKKKEKEDGKAKLAD